MAAKLAGRFGMAFSASLQRGTGHGTCDYREATVVIVTEQGTGRCFFYPYATRALAEVFFWSLKWKLNSRILYKVVDGLPGEELLRGGPALPYNTIRAAAAKLCLHQKVFVQEAGPGVASVHFLACDAAFLSYDGPECAAWRLDDGSALPKRKSFDRVVYDPATRTFTGHVSWMPTSFCGDQVWEYAMVFDETFSQVVGGQIHHYTPGLTDRGSSGQVLVFGPEADAAASVVSYRRFRAGGCPAAAGPAENKEEGGWVEPSDTNSQVQGAAVAPVA